MICDKVEPLRTSKHADSKAFDDVFNELMLEEVRLMMYLLKFGYYKNDELGDVNGQPGGGKNKGSSVDS